MHFGLNIDKIDVDLFITPPTPSSDVISTLFASTNLRWPWRLDFYLRLRVPAGLRFVRHRVSTR